MSHATRRLALLALGLTAVVPACSGECRTDVQLVVLADGVCPTAQGAENHFQDREPDSFIEEPAKVRLVQPGTLCWYRAEQLRSDACDFPTPDAVAAAIEATAFDPFDHEVSCDDGGFLYGAWLSADVTTQAEAAATTIADCTVTLPTEEQDRLQIGYGFVVGDFVSSNFIAGRVECTYELFYSCDRGCSCFAGPTPFGPG